MLICKREILTREIKKFAFDGSRMREGEDYDKTYAPVALWMSIQILLTFVMVLDGKCNKLATLLHTPKPPSTATCTWSSQVDSKFLVVSTEKLLC